MCKICHTCCNRSQGCKGINYAKTSEEIESNGANVQKLHTLDGLVGEIFNTSDNRQIILWHLMCK